jgi:hypothetical protein
VRDAELTMHCHSPDLNLDNDFYDAWTTDGNQGVSVPQNVTVYCFRAGVQLYTRASGHARIDGHLIPTADIE